MLASTCRSKLLFFTCLLFFAVCSFAQVTVRPYTQVFSRNIKGNTAIFGNTVMHIVENDTVALRKMNESGIGENGQAGNSQYGNDNSNMQFASIDAPSSNVNLFSLESSSWRWFQPQSDADVGTAWRTFNDPATWNAGNSGFGYGYIQHTVLPGSRPSTYFVKTINVSSPSLYSGFNFTLAFAEGVVVYINGVEVKRLNMPASNILFNTAATVQGLSLGNTFTIGAEYFNSGDNVIAVEVHKKNINSNIAYFDMALNAVTYSPVNSSAAELILPAGSNTIKFARLYWGGKVNNALLNASPDTLQKIRIRKGLSGAYEPLMTSATNTDQFVLSDETAYQSYIDITGFIQSNGSGYYSIADVPSSTGYASNGGKYAGWCIMIAYENPVLPFRSLRIYDGYSQVFNNGNGTSQTVILSDLNVPDNNISASDARFSTMVWEGDANFGSTFSNPAGDYIRINNIAVSNPANPSTNFWNGSITENGHFKHNKIPDYYNQMGIDIDDVEVGTGYNILPGANTVQVDFGTEADQYFPSVFAFSIRMQEPEIYLDKVVTDANANGTAESNEVLTYTLSGLNTGPGKAFNCVVVDTLPANVTYIPNSLQIIHAPGIPSSQVDQTDAFDNDYAFTGTAGTKTYVKFFIGEGASFNNGGLMDITTSYSLRFKVRAPVIPASVLNTATIYAKSQSGNTYSDDGTALISATAATVPITLLNFSGSVKNNISQLLWSTENELNNHHFNIQRSDDGIHFIQVGTVNANGTSSLTHYYTFNDPLPAPGKIFYYRLKAVSNDGSGTYTKVIALKRDQQENIKISVTPNPFTDQLNILIKDATSNTAEIRIFDALGKCYLSRIIAIDKGDNLLVLRDLSITSKGVYTLLVKAGNDTITEKILRE